MVKTKGPVWRIWKHKKEGWLVFDLQWFLSRPASVLAFKPDYTADDFEEINPDGFTIRKTLKFSHCYKSRNTVVFFFADAECSAGELFSISLKEIEKIIKDTTMYAGVVEGEWRFQKRGGVVKTYLVRECEEDDNSSFDD